MFNKYFLLCDYSLWNQSLNSKEMLVKHPQRKLIKNLFQNPVGFCLKNMHVILDKNSD